MALVQGSQPICFYGISDVDVGVSLAATFGFVLVCLAAIWAIFRTGYKLKT